MFRRCPRVEKPVITVKNENRFKRLNVWWSLSANSGETGNNPSKRSLSIGPLDGGTTTVTSRTTVAVASQRTAASYGAYRWRWLGHTCSSADSPFAVVWRSFVSKNFIVPTKIIIVFVRRRVFALSGVIFQSLPMKI